MQRRFLTTLFVLGLLGGLPSVVAAQDKVAGSGFLPANTQAVITVNVKQMLECPLVKKDLPKLQEQIKSNAEATKRLTALGFDPFKDLDSITIGAAGVEDNEQVVIVARGKFDTAKFKALADKEKDNVKTHMVNGQAIYEANVPGQQKPLFMALVDGNTIVAGMKQSDVADAFEIKAGKKKSEVKKDLQGLLAKSNPSQSLSVVMLGSALGNGIPFGDKVENINGGVILGDDIKTSFVITTKDAESAKGLSELLQQALEQGKQFVAIFAQQQKELEPLAGLINVLKVEAKENLVTIKGDVSKDALEKLKKN